MPSISFFKPAALTLATTLALTASLPLAQAQAGGRHKGEIIAAGVIGLALGAIIADSSRHRQYRADIIYYNQPAYVPPLPVLQYANPYYQPYPGAGTYYDESYRNNSYDRPRDIAPHNHNNYRKITQPAPPRRYTEPKVITYNDTQSYNAEPWSTGWYNYCRNKFRSFNAKSGTYLGYDGKRHFCIAK